MLLLVDLCCTACAIFCALDSVRMHGRNRMDMLQVRPFVRPTICLSLSLLLHRSIHPSNRSSIHSTFLCSLWCFCTQLKLKSRLQSYVRPSSTTISCDIFCSCSFFFLPQKKKSCQSGLSAFFCGRLPLQMLFGTCCS